MTIYICYKESHYGGNDSTLEVVKVFDSKLSAHNYTETMKRDFGGEYIYYWYEPRRVNEY